MTKHIGIGEVTLGNDLPIAVIGGINVLESRELAMTVADAFAEATTANSIPWIFKASFDKANRSSMHSPRGPGLDAGLSLLQEVKEMFNVPVITDIHEVSQAGPVGEICDVIQIPAFLCRQTDLICAAAKTGKPVMVKKAQFLAPEDMAHVLAKLEAAGCDRGFLCERGSQFGYHGLVVDPVGLHRLKNHDVPVVLDATHGVQIPGGKGGAAGGVRDAVAPLAQCGTAIGIAGLFLEAHSHPDQALCDGPSVIHMDSLPALLKRIANIDKIVKE